MSILFYFFIFFYIILIIYFAFKNDWSMICFFLIAVMFQNIILIIFSDNISNVTNTLFSLLKEGMLYLALGLYIIKKRDYKFDKKSILIFIVIVFCIIKNFINTSATFSAALISFRQCVIPFLGIAIGKTIKINATSMKKMMKFQLYYSLFLAFFGLIEILFLKDAFWNRIGYAQYLYVKQGTLPSQLYHGVTRNFYTWDFFNIPIRRLVSITADPLATAHLIFLGLVIIAVGCINYKNNNSYKGSLNQNFLYYIFLIICCILSLSKAIFLFLAIVMVVIMYFKNILPKFITKHGAIAIGIFGLIYIFLNMQGLNSTTATLNHINGLINGFKSSSLLGEGLGTAGVMTSQITNSSITTVESYVGAYVQQIGFLGLTLTVIYFYRTFKTLLTQWYKYRSNFTILAISIFLGLIIEMFFSESSVSIMGTCIYFVYIGIATQDNCYKDVHI